MGVTLDARRGSRARRGGKKRRQRRAEPIEMRERRHGYFPKSFVRRGQRYDVYAVERCWTVSRRGGRVERHYFRVRCSFGSTQDRPFGGVYPEQGRGAQDNPFGGVYPEQGRGAQDRPFGSTQDRREGTFEVYQDVRHNTWHLQRQVA